MKICYFGTYNPEWGRSRIYMKGLRENGVEIIECKDNSWGPLKFVKLFLKHWKIRNDYDALIVGYPGHVVVPLAKIISKKEVVFDALCTMYEGVIISRKQFNEWSPNTIYIKLIDWLAVKFADIVLVETKSQKRFFEERFGKSYKYKVVYIGADDDLFYKDNNTRKRDKFTVVFRGKFLPEAGVKHVIKAADILKNEKIDFIIMGNGWLEKEIKYQISSLKSKNVQLITENLSFEELRKRMLEGHISLGQLEDHERLSRTIPHKCYESLAMGLPYVTARAGAVAEELTDGEDVFFVNPADPQDLADKILHLKNNPEIANKIGDNGYKLFQQKFTPQKLAGLIVKLISDK